MNQKKHDAMVKKCIRDAEKKNVSVFFLMKKELGYRHPKPTEEMQLRHCLSCRHNELVCFENTRDQCKLIGISESKTADVDAEHICNEYKFK